MNYGKISLIIGSSKAGKTTELIRQINRYKNKNENICCICPNQSYIYKEFIQTNILFNVIDNPQFIESNIIIIDDLHMFKDANIILPIMANKMFKTIIAASLDNNCDREPYEQIIDLIPKCDYVKKMNAFCSVLQDTTPAIFSKEIKGKILPISREAYLNKKCGFLHVITGPMYSGKTTELLRICKKYKSINKKIFSINYEKDKRFSFNADICSHNQETIKTSISLSNLNKILENNLDEYDVIVIDEVQFLQNAFDTIKILVEDYKKTVIASGLDGDYLQNPFGDVCRLITFADKLTRLNAICKLSNNYQDAAFSRRIASSKETEFIGAEDAYIAVSRQLYNLNDEEFYNILKEKSEIIYKTSSSL